MDSAQDSWKENSFRGSPPRVRSANHLSLFLRGVGSGAQTETDRGQQPHGNVFSCLSPYSNWNKNSTRRNKGERNECPAGEKLDGACMVGRRGKAHEGRRLGSRVDSWTWPVLYPFILININQMIMVCQAVVCGTAVCLREPKALRKRIKMIQSTILSRKCSVTS